MSLSQLAEMTAFAMGMVTVVSTLLLPVIAAIAYWAWVKSGKPTTASTGLK